MQTEARMEKALEDEVKSFVKKTRNVESLRDMSNKVPAVLDEKLGAQEAVAIAECFTSFDQDSLPQLQDRARAGNKGKRPQSRE